VSASNPAPWSSSYRLVLRKKWKAKSAALGNAVTEALVEYSRPLAEHGSFSIWPAALANLRSAWRSGLVPGVRLQRWIRVLNCSP